MARVAPGAWVAICRDDAGQDTAGLRTQFKAAHFEYIEGILERLLVAGPLRDQAGGAQVASLFVYAADSEAEARSLLENDPYWRAGIYASVTLEPFQPAAGSWIGGKIW